MDIPKETEDMLYGKILDAKLVMRDLAEHFRTYSARDIEKLIQAKMKAKTLREPAALQELYRLEEIIRDLRESMEEAKSERGGT
jgi:hypothetical protein